MACAKSLRPPHLTSHRRPRNPDSRPSAVKRSNEAQACCYHARMDTQVRTTFGKALKAAIAAARYTQAGLARELHIDAGQVSRWVNGKAIPHKETAAKIEQILGADLSAALAASSPEYELYVAAPITGLKD